MLNINEWKTGDAEWVASRNEMWDEKLFPYLKKNDSWLPPDGEREESFRQAKAFYDGEQLGYPEDYNQLLSAAPWKIRLVMLPCLSVENIRFLYRYNFERRGLKVCFPLAFSEIQNRLAPLIALGVLPEEVIDNFVTALWGGSLEEAKGIWGVDDYPDSWALIENVENCLLGWALSRDFLDCDFLPYQRILVFYLEALRLVDESIVENMEWVMKKIVRNVNRFDSGKTADLPRRKAFIELFKKRIKEERIRSTLD